MSRILLIALWVCIPAAAPSLSAQDGQSRLSQLNAQFESAKSKALAPILARMEEAERGYETSLASLEKTLMTKGDLDALLEVKNERETFASSSTTGAGDLEALTPLRDAYVESKQALNLEEEQTLNRLNGVYRDALTNLITELTKANQLDEAIKAKAVLEGLPKPGATASVESTPPASKSPWSAPPPSGDDVLNGGTFLKPITLPPGRHRLRDKIIIGAREPARPNNVYLLEGTSISCTDKGEIFVMTGEGNAFGVTFESAIVTGGLGADWTFINCVLDRTFIGKGDGWSGKHQASVWKFDNCLVSGDLVESWNTQDMGYYAESSNFDGIKFPDLSYRQEPGTLAQSDALVFKNCHFRKCDIPLSVLISTVNCTFDDCSFRDDARPISLKQPITVTVFTRDCTNRIRKAPDSVTIETKEFDEASGEAGASLTLP